MRLLINTNNSYLQDLYNHHEHYHDGDSGIDLYCPDTITIEPGEFKKIDLGIKCEALNNNRYTSEETTSGFIYIIRDPRDVVVSFSKHLNKNIDDTISVMTSNESMTIPSDDRTLTLISSWNMHYESWNTLKTPFLILKYEDLLKNIEFEVKRIIEFLGKLLEINVKDLNKKLDGVCKTTNINKFIEYENKFGFDEATKNQKFFSKIQSNSKKKLSIGQTKIIEEKFYKIMKEFGYIN